MVSNLETWASFDYFILFLLFVCIKVGEKSMLPNAVQIIIAQTLLWNSLRTIFSFFVWRKLFKPLFIW